MWNGWVGRVLEGYGGVEWVGLERSWKVIEEENGWVGRVLEGYRDTVWVRLEESWKIIEVSTGLA